MTTSDGLIARVLRERVIPSSVAAEWRTLAERRGSPFTTPEWFESALATIDSDREPAVVVVERRDGHVAGVLPLVAGRGGRDLAFAGARSADRLGPASDPADEEVVAHAAGAAVAEAYPRWREVRLRNVDRAPWTEALRRGLGRTAAQSLPPVRLPYVQLDGLDRDSYLAGRSRSFRSQAGRRLRALCREHAVAVRLDRRPESVASSLERVLRLHGERWSERQGVSSLASSEILDFHRDFARRAAQRDWSRTVLLEADGEPVAGWYGWAIGGRWLYYQAGFDPAWSSNSVGTLLMIETIAAATADGAREYDLLQGDEDFKFRFADREREAQTLVITRALSGARIRAAAGAVARRGWRRIPEERRARLLELVARRRG